MIFIDFIDRYKKVKTQLREIHRIKWGKFNEINSGKF